MDSEERDQKLVEQAYSYLTTSTYPPETTENKKRVIRKKAKKFDLKDGELYYSQPGVVNVYDSASKYITQRNKEEIAALLHTSEDVITLQYKNVQHQYGGSDCGLFALAFATALTASTDPTACTFDQGLMRQHFLKCIKKGKMEEFPLKQPRSAGKGRNF